MHLLLSGEEQESFLQAEILQAAPGSRVEVIGPQRLAWKNAPSLGEPLLPLVFSRQMLPDARFVQAASIRLWAEVLFQAVTASLPEDGLWRIHVVPRYGTGRAGRTRCELIGQALGERLHRKRRHLARGLETGAGPWTPATSLVQLVLIDEEKGFLSVATAPTPWRQRRLVVPFPEGEIPVARDPAAPSRAFAKLVEAEQRLGVSIQRGESCVDLGASPGSWSYVALQRGATVTAVDRAPLRDDLMAHRQLRFVRGDAFTYCPERRVDWLLCDVIAAPERSMDLVCRWTRERWARRFVVALKFKGTADYGCLERLKRELPAACAEWHVTRLCANRNEACVFGQVRADAASTPAPSPL